MLCASAPTPAAQRWYIHIRSTSPSLRKHPDPRQYRLSRQRAARWASPPIGEPMNDPWVSPRPQSPSFLPCDGSPLWQPATPATPAAQRVAASPRRDPSGSDLYHRAPGTKYPLRAVPCSDGVIHARRAHLHTSPTCPLLRQPAPTGHENGGPNPATAVAPYPLAGVATMRPQSQVPWRSQLPRSPQHRDRSRPVRYHSTAVVGRRVTPAAVVGRRVTPAAIAGPART